MKKKDFCRNGMKNAVETKHIILNKKDIPQTYGNKCQLSYVIQYCPFCGKKLNNEK